MLNQQNEIIKIFALVITLMVSSTAFAVDKSIYYGEWKGKFDEKNISLNISKKKVSIDINGKSITSSIEYEYTYSKKSPYPFLSIYFTDKQEDEHLIYLVVGTDSKCNKTMLNGFYEQTRIIPDGHGKLKSESYNIELLK